MSTILEDDGRDYNFYLIIYCNTFFYAVGRQVTVTAQPYYGEPRNRSTGKGYDGTTSARALLRHEPRLGPLPEIFFGEVSPLRNGTPSKSMSTRSEWCVTRANRMARLLHLQK